MLTFKRVGDLYQVTERMLGFPRDCVKIVQYKADLSECRVNTDPWKPCTKLAVDWFEKNYRQHFTGKPVINRPDIDTIRDCAKMTEPEVVADIIIKLCDYVLYLEEQ